MKYTPDPHLSDTERLMAIEIMLVNALDVQGKQETILGRMQKLLWTALGIAIASFGAAADWIGIFSSSV